MSTIERFHCTCDVIQVIILFQRSDTIFWRDGKNRERNVIDNLCMTQAVLGRAIAPVLRVREARDIRILEQKV